MQFKSDYQITIPNLDILTFLFEQSPFKQSDPIWIDGTNPTSFVTLSQARSLTLRIGQALRDIGIGATGRGQDVVLTYIENQVMVAPSCFGVLCAGGIHATCPITATAFELGRQIGLSRPRVLICSEATRPVAEDAISRSGVEDVQLLVMRSATFDLLHSGGRSVLSDRELEWEKITDQKLLESTTACLVYSSGTTGVPKGVEITHYNLVSNLCQMAFHFSHFSGKAIREDTYLRMPGIMSSAVVLGITVQTMMALQTGIQVYMFPKFEFGLLLESMKKYQLNTFFLVPAIWSRIADACTKKDMRGWRFAMSGASMLPLSVQKRLEDMLPEGVRMRVNWGMTEMTTAASQPAADEGDEEGSVGRLLPNVEALIQGPDGKGLGVGEVGELCIKGPNVIKRYFKNPQATEAAFTADGWFRTGDVAYFSEKGKLFIVGRSKELLKYKSHQISPPELEGILVQHSSVVDAGVIGIADGQGNDLARAYIVASPSAPAHLGGSDNAALDKEIHEFLNSRVSNYKRLRGGIVFVDEIPRNVTGKIMRNVLQEWAKKDRDATGMARARL